MISLPLSRGLSRPLSFRSAMDADAVAYIAALETAGATVTSGQRTAINTFVEDEKSGSRWDGHKRLYLPIWGVAAANAICMKSLTSGTFVGGVTHGAGFVNGNGTTGYFNMGLSPFVAGLTPDDAHAWAISRLADSRINERAMLGSYNGATNNDLYLVSQDLTQIRIDSGNASTSGKRQVALARANHTGVISGGRKNGRWLLNRRHSGGSTALLDEIAAVIGTAPDFALFAMAVNVSGTAYNFSDAQFGGWGVGLGLSLSQSADLAGNLKTLWETCTGLTLP